MPIPPSAQPAPHSAEPTKSPSRAPNLRLSPVTRSYHRCFPKTNNDTNCLRSHQPIFSSPTISCDPRTDLASSAAPSQPLADALALCSGDGILTPSAMIKLTLLPPSISRKPHLQLFSMTPAMLTISRLPSQPRKTLATVAQLPSLSLV